ncbi:unnamed protein product [Timema podura]|uniref:Uncharacterized protein n=2 Tax=Timema TaxID=61471 RepID=A0ABN7NYC7_TIMPD|nr:unnamed protein product [Timema podura]
MESCDILLVNEETVKLIKTEPQSNEYNMSEKYEDYNLADDHFNCTIKNESQHFQTSDVEMKSPWDGFLPIKEQIKDESNASDYVDEIVKTEMKFLDDSQEINDFTSYHYTPENNAKVFKL